MGKQKSNDVEMFTEMGTRDVLYAKDDAFQPGGSMRLDGFFKIKWVKKAA